MKQAGMFLAGFAMAIFFTACTEDPAGILDEPGRSPLSLSAVQVPEEEILGSVYRNKVKIGIGEDYTVTLTPVAGSGACIFRADNPSSCLSTSFITVMPNGSRPGKPGTNMWGWFDNLDTDNNPCRPGAADKGEWHDENGNGVRDSGFEKHCVRLGRYTVSVAPAGDTALRSRTVDHLATTSSTIDGRVVEDPSGPSAFDTFVHFDVGATGHSVSNNTLRIDNPATSTLFAPGDTVVAPGVAVRFESMATTSWSGGPSIGKLMYRMQFDRNVNPSDRSGYWNPDAVIRTRSYTQTRSYATRAEVATALDSGDVTSRLSNQRTILVQSGVVPVASVDISPATATIGVGGTVQLTATLRDANGNILTGRTITWTSENPSVATVSGSGSTATATGQASGTAQIRATSEGVSDWATITVQQGGGTNNAAAAGHTLPSSFVNGSVVSVTVTMQNTGQTTWTSTGGYQLDLWRDGAFWATVPVSVGVSVSPGGTQVFTFDLRMDDPWHSGTTACFFRMRQNGVFFGAENGRDINVTQPK